MTLREQVTEGLLSPVLLPPGRVFAIGRDRADRRPCVFRIEVELVPGTGRALLSRIKAQSASSALMTAYDHVRNHLTEFGISSATTDRDLHVQILNPMEADDPIGLSLGILLAIVSALRRAPVPPGFAVAGDMSVQGAILPPDSIGEMVLLARESGAVRLALPTANRDDVERLPAGLRDGLEFRHFDSQAGLAQEILDS